MSIKGYKGITEEVVAQTSYKGRLLRFLFNPPPLASVPVRANGFAKHPIDLVTHLGLVRSTAYFEAGCPLELCDHAAARDLWNVIHQDIIQPEVLCT